MAIRAAMHQLGGVLFEKFLNADGGGHQGAHIDCGQGHQAEFVDYRGKKIVTVLAPVEVVRAYYHCAACHGGKIPKDEELDIAGTSLSPGVRRTIGHVGGREPFDQGHVDLEILAGITVKTKQVERVAEAIGRQVEAIAQTGRVHRYRRDGSAGGTRGKPGANGQGRKWQSQNAGGQTGFVFTQSKVDAKGFLIRDAASTS